MKKFCFLVALSLFAACVTNVRASIVVIDFEGLSDLEIVDNQYLGLGVDFNGHPSALRVDGTLNSFFFPPLSGQTVIYNQPSSVIRVDAIGGDWDYVGGYITGNAAITLTAYDSGDNVIGTVTTSGPNYTGAGTPNEFISITGAGIAYATFADSGNAFTIDDFQFRQGGQGTIPEPGTMAIWSVLGLAALGLRRRQVA